jgi:hypothetical protein
MRLRFFGGVMVLSALALLLSAVPSGAGDQVALPGGSARVGALPAIPVRITNETDTMLSLSVTSAACTPRILLEPRASITVGDCLRWGLVHQVKPARRSRSRGVGASSISVRV